MKDAVYSRIKFIQVSFRHSLLAKTRSVGLAYVCTKRNLVNVRAFNKDNFLMPVIVFREIRLCDTSHYSMRDNLFFFPLEI